MPARITHLSSYLEALIKDVAAQGKVIKIQGDPVQIAAVALLSGSIAVGEAFLADVTVLAGRAKVQAKMMARPVAEMVAARGVGFLFDKLLGK